MSERYRAQMTTDSRWNLADVWEAAAELFGEPGYDTSGFERPDYLRDYGDASAPQGGHRDYR